MNEKPVYRSSNLIHYPACPKKYYLSTLHDQKQTSAMRDGLLFEGYLFGFKSGEKEQKELEGSKKAVTLGQIRRIAEKVNDVFKFKGAKFNKYKIEFDDFILQGESDFRGHTTNFVYSGEPVKGLVDIKFTADIDRNWNQRNSKPEYIQAPMYTFLELATEHQTSNELTLFQKDPLPFYYLVIEKKYDEEPLFALIPVKVTREDLKWLWNKILQVHNAREIGYIANDNYDNCLGIGAYSGRCPYLQWCEEGRNLVAFNREVEFSQLNET